jgi:hypothetical protein
MLFLTPLAFAVAQLDAAIAQAPPFAFAAAAAAASFVAE